MPACLSRRAMVLGLALSPAACGDAEADQRRAFTAWLQQRVLDKQGLHVPRPSAEEAQGWGEYAKHYAVITDFHDGLSEHISKPMQAAVERGALRSIQDLLDRKAQVVEVRAGMADLSGELEKRIAVADAAHAALKQPADLKAVYDAAYDREVTVPMKAVKGVFPAADASLGAALDLANYIEQHKAVVRVSGAMLQVSDPAVQAVLATKMEAMNVAAQRAQEAQRQLQAMVNG